METSARDAYLDAQIMTATPQKLRLMLIEGALRFVRQAMTAWDEGDELRARESVSRCRAVVSELLSGVQPDGSDLTKRVAAVYVFLYRRLTDATWKGERHALDDVVRVLEVEQETWRAVCENLPGDADRSSGDGFESQKPNIRQDEGSPVPPSNGLAMPEDGDLSSAGGGLVLDA